MARKTPPFPEYEDWTTARFFSFIRSGLRQLWSRWPPKYKVLAEARRKSQSENKRLKWEFLCASCGFYFPQKEVQVDHLEDAGTLRSFEDLPGFAQRLFVGEDKLQVLCQSCHKRITKERKLEKISTQ